MNDLSKRWQAGFVVASAVALLLIAFHWHRPGALIAQGDSLFGFDPLNQLRKSLFAWNHNDGFFGADDPSTVWAPWLLVSGLLTRLLTASIAQILMMWLTLVVAWSGMFALLRKLGCSTLAALGASWAYTLNPWTQTMLAVNGAPPYMWTLALIPWYGRFVIDGATDATARRRSMAIAAVTTFVALPMICANPVLLVVFALSVAAFAGLGTMLATDATGFRRWLFAAAGVCAICSLWWLFPLLNAYRAPVLVTTSAESWAWVVQRASLLNDMRMNSTWAWIHPEYFPFAAGYDANPLTYASGFLLIVGLAIALATAKGPRARHLRYVAAVALAALFLSKGLHPPLVWLSDWIYKIPGMFLFREPTSKWPLLASPLLAVALGWAADQLIVTVKAKRPLAGRWAIAAVMLTATAFSASAALSGRIFHDETANYHEEAPGLPSEYIKLPGYWKDAARYIDAAPGGGGVLVLPADPYYQVDYDWGWYGADFMPNYLIHRRVLMLAPLGYVGDAKANAIEQRIATALERRSPQFAKMLSDLGLRFVLWRGDAHVRNGEVGLPASRAAVEAVLAGVSKRAFGPLEIFDLGQDVSHAVRVSSDWVVGQYGESSPADVLELRAFDERVPRFDIGASPPIPNTRPLRFERRIDEPLFDALGDAAVRALAQGVPARLLASGGQPRGAGVLRQSNADIAVRASFLRDEPRRIDIQVAVTALQSSREPVGTPLVSAIATTSESNGDMALALFNPGRRFVQTDVDVGVQPDGEKTYLFQGRTGSFIDTLRASDAVVWVRFRGVWLAPGQNDFELSSSASRRRGARDGDSQPGLRIGSIHLSNIRKENEPALRPTAQARTAFATAQTANWTRQLGGVTLEVPAVELPALTLQFPAWPAETLRGILTARVGSTRYLCYARFHPQVPSSVSAALIRCFDNSRDRVDPHDALVERVDLEATLAAPSSPDIANLMRGQLVISRQLHPPWDRPNRGVFLRVGGHALDIKPRQTSFVATSFPHGSGDVPVVIMPHDARLSILSLGEPPCRCGPERPTTMLADIDGLLIARSPLPDTGVILTDEVYSPEWFGILVGSTISGLRHLQADGWRNAWSVPGSGTIVLFNVAVLAQMIFFVCGFATLVILMVRRR